MDYRQIRFEQVQDQTGTRPCQMAQKDGGLRWRSLCRYNRSPKRQHCRQSSCCGKEGREESGNSTCEFRHNGYHSQDAGYGGNSQNICNSGCRHRISLRRIQGSVSGCHPLGCNPDRKRQIGNRNRRRTFQYDNDDGQCRRFIRQNSRQQSGGIHHPVARPALRTNGCGTELHRTFLS